MGRLAVTRWDEHYAAGRGFAPVTDGELDVMADHLGPGGGRTLLDVGCGTGELTRHLAARRFDATGADLSSTAVKAARENTGFGGPVFVQWDADRDDTAALPADRFDVVTCRLVWAFLGAAGRRRVVSLLEPGGVLCVLTPVREQLARRLNTGMSEEEIIDLQAGFASSSRVDFGVLALLALRDSGA